MRTIKLFEDFNTGDFKKELEDFCEMYLAYLIDEGFEVEVSKNMHEKYYVLNIKKVSAFANYTDGEYGTRNIDNSFRWSEISNHFVVFFHMLSKEYDLVKSVREPYGTINLREEMSMGRRVGWVWKNYVDIEDLDPDKKIDLIQIPIDKK